MISIIVAMDKHRLIGKDNDLPWKLSSDLKRFKKITTGHSIFMGRKTYESIGKPLPKRNNFVISRNTNLKIEGCTVLPDLQELLKKDEEIFCIGGSQAYKMAMPYVKKFYLTIVDGEFNGNIYFPEIPPQFTKISSIYYPSSEKDPHAHSFSILIL